MENYIKLANTEFTKDELEYYIRKNENYMMCYRRIYEITKDEKMKKGYKCKQIYYHKGALPLTKAGRFFMVTEQKANVYIKK